MAGDYARWLASETTATLTHDTPADPFSRIPDPNSRYEGTVLETSAERAARETGPEEAGR